LQNKKKLKHWPAELLGFRQANSPNDLPAGRTIHVHSAFQVSTVQADMKAKLYVHGGPYATGEFSPKTPELGRRRNNLDAYAVMYLSQYFITLPNAKILCSEIQYGYNLPFKDNFMMNVFHVGDFLTLLSFA
jgi:hypothetical protein